MPATAQVTIHASQFPGAIRRDLLASLRSRRVNHKFHYDSVRQTQQWLALHRAFSPSRHDRDCAAAYNRAFAETVARIKARQVHLLGLGCGGGQKDTRLLRRLQARGKGISYTPCDVSVAMTLVARQAAMSVVPAKRCFPFVCDLATAGDLSSALAHGIEPRAARLITFFGMIPNFEPQAILPKLAALTCRNDLLLFSANLAPGNDYIAGMQRILPQYDNALTRDWLMTFLLDLGVERGDGNLRIAVEPGASGLRRVVAWFHFRRRRRVNFAGKQFEFRRGEAVRLFFSYRYTPDRVRALLRRHGLCVQEQWITRSGEEGVFLCRRLS